ncbi:MAG: hypothetical protein O9256_02015 [Rhizobiaceae bacterium]|nr:hypothetical protein [Rhizobiaceae bacterium]MCZ8349858.1 hypothetical protein [Rhizobium sp.]
MLTPPPRDQNGAVEPHDHPEISNDDGVIRRIPQHWVVPGKDGSPRLSSMAFKASSGENAGMSVDLEALIVEAGLDPRTYVNNPKWVGSVRFTAGSLRAEGFMVGYDPLDEEPPDQSANPYHGEVWGSFSKGKQRRLAEIAAWFVELPGVSLTAG